MKLRLTFALLVFPGLFLAFPQSRKILTNSDIISMVNQGVPDSAIVRAIELFETAFNTSPEARARLDQAGVSEDIIKAMIAAEASKGSIKKFIPGMDRETEPAPIRQPRPPYTDEARAARVEGILVLSVNIRKDGTVDQIKVLRGLGYGLDESAINTISTSWLFRPGTFDGIPRDVQANIDVTFRLAGSPNILFNTFGPKDVYLSDRGGELGFQNGDSWVQAIGFKPISTGKVDRYEIAVSRAKGGSRLTAWLCDAYGNHPGPVIEQFTFFVPPGSDNLRLLADSSLHPTLYAEKYYWLAVAPPDLKTESFRWYCNDPLPGALHAQGHSPNGPWNLDAQPYVLTLRIIGTAR